MQSESPLNEHRQSSGIGGDFHRLREHGGASLTELHEFVRKLHGRSPSEVLGIVSGSALIRALAEATVYMSVVIVVFTVIPFMLGGDEKTKAVASTPTATSSSANGPAANPSTTATTGAASNDDNISEEDAQKAVDVMGLGETKIADPDKNPLDKLDTLLDDVK